MRRSRRHAPGRCDRAAAARRRTSLPRRRPSPPSLGRVRREGTSPATAKAARVRNRALHDALRDFALEAASALGAELNAGAEIPFEVVEEPGGSTVLYNYKPLTTEFIAARW